MSRSTPCHIPHVSIGLRGIIGSFSCRRMTPLILPHFHLRHRIAHSHTTPKRLDPPPPNRPVQSLHLPQCCLGVLQTGLRDIRDPCLFHKLQKRPLEFRPTIMLQTHGLQIHRLQHGLHCNCTLRSGLVLQQTELALASGDLYDDQYGKPISFQKQKITLLGPRLPHDRSQ
jgi:hypothetical protein